jgi:hypothetical protein
MNVPFKLVTNNVPFTLVINNHYIISIPVGEFIPIQWYSRRISNLVAVSTYTRTWTVGKFY